MKLYQYAVLWHPTEKQRDEEGKQSKIIVPLETTLCKDSNAAMLLAARQIQPEYMEKLEQVEVVVRPF